VPRWHRVGNQQHGQHTHGEFQSPPHSAGQQPSRRAATGSTTPGRPWTLIGKGIQGIQVLQDWGDASPQRDKATTPAASLRDSHRAAIQPHHARKRPLAPDAPNWAVIGSGRPMGRRPGRGAGPRPREGAPPRPASGGRPICQVARRPRSPPAGRQAASPTKLLRIEPVKAGPR